MGQSAYEMPAQEWKIGYGSVLTDYIMQAYMTAKARPKPTDVSLEVGTGSGFQSSILSRIVKKAYTIEIITSLGDKVKNIFAPLGFDNVESRVGDGFFGWPEVEGGFDIILVTAQAPFVPPALLCPAEEGRADDHPDRPALEAAVPVHVHKGRAGQGAFAARRVHAVHPHDRTDPDPPAPARRTDEPAEDAGVPFPRLALRPLLRDVPQPLLRPRAVLRLQLLGHLAGAPGVLVRRSAPDPRPGSLPPPQRRCTCS